MSYYLDSEWSRKYQRRLWWLRKEGTSLKFILNSDDLAELHELIGREVAEHVSLGDSRSAFTPH